MSTPNVPAYEKVTWLSRFIVCARCGSLVLMWKTEIHDRACGGRFLEPIRLEARLSR